MVTLLLFCFGFFEKKGCTPKRVFFTFLPVRAYKLHSTFSFTRCTTTMQCQNKQGRAWRLYYKLYERRDDKETKKKSESRLKSYIVLLNIQGFVDTKPFSQVPFSL